MSTPRRKSPRQDAPQTIGQAIALLDEYRDTTARIAQLAADARAAIGQIEAARDAFAKPLEARAVDIFRQLRAWWAVAAPELTGGKRKSMPLAGCIIGERTAPPALKLPKGKKVNDIVAELLDTFGGTFIVTTNKLDKPAIIKALRQTIVLEGDGSELTDEQARILGEISILRGEIGLEATQAEDFFIDLPGRDPATQTVSADGSDAPAGDGAGA